MNEYSITGYLEKLSSKEPVPGGGGACCIAAALGCSLSEMVCNLTIGKKKYAAFSAELGDTLQKLADYRRRFLELSEKDAEVFSELARCYALPKATKEEQAVKEEEMLKVLNQAVIPPMDVISECTEVLKMTARIAQIGSLLVLSDAGAAAGLLCGAAESAAFSVKANTRLMKSREKARSIDELLSEMLSSCRELAEEVKKTVDRRLSV